MDRQLLLPLNELDTSLTSLISSLTTSNTFSLAPQSTRDLLSADASLSQALTTLSTHQENYTRILKLRAKAERLQNQLKDVVRTCVDLRREVGSIGPGILDDDDDDADSEDEEEDEDEGKEQRAREKERKKVNKVDYTTLLSFAARIGKHNAVAAHEAERESLRRKTEARKNLSSIVAEANKRSGTGGPGSMSVSNNVNGNTGDLAEANVESQDTQATTTLESLAEVARMNDVVLTQRASAGMGFPAAEILRLGALGRLQVLREERGEMAVDEEVERLVEDSEGFDGRGMTKGQKDKDPDLDQDEMMEDVDAGEKAEVVKQNENTKSRELDRSQQLQQQQRQQQQQQQQQRQSVPPARRKLDLDFPGSDDDDDDD